MHVPLQVLNDRLDGIQFFMQRPDALKALRCACCTQCLCLRLQGWWQAGMQCCCSGCPSNEAASRAAAEGAATHCLPAC